MTLRGNVQDFPLRSVLELLGQTKKTGELQVRAGERVGALGITGGRVVTAVLDEEDPLIALGAIFALEGAEFEFTPWDDAPPANLDEKNLDELLRMADEAKHAAEAARKKADDERVAERERLEEIRALIPNDNTPLRLSERAIDQGPVTLTSERWRLVLAVNGVRDVNAIAAMLHIDPAAALISLAALVRDGVVEPVAGYEAPQQQAPAYEAPAPPYEPPAPAYETPAYEAPAYQAPAYEAPSFDPPAARFESPPEAAPERDIPAATQDWITPDQAVPSQDWTMTPAAPAPISEVAPQWAPTPESAAPAPDWITPHADQPAPETDDRLSALSGIFGPAPAEPQAPPPPAGSPTSSWPPPAAGSDHWGTPPEPTVSAERWTAPPKTAPAPATSGDPWGSPPPSAPAEGSWAAPAPAQTSAPTPATEKDEWVAPAPAPPQRTWSAPAGGTSANDPWGSPPGADPRTAAMRIPEPPTPPVEEWSPPPAAAPEKKKKGLFGFGRDKPAPPPVAGMPLPTASAHGSRVGIVAALANALIAEYNNGQYGKGRIDERIANLLMRVDEQADPIDRPLPIVDDRIDVEALEREQLADSQALPYLALLVTTIFADAEKQFGKDKAKKGYKAAQKSVLLGDASALSSPELAGKLPRV